MKCTYLCKLSKCGNQVFENQEEDNYVSDYDDEENENSANDNDDVD